MMVMDHLVDCGDDHGREGRHEFYDYNINSDEKDHGDDHV